MALPAIIAYSLVSPPGELSRPSVVEFTITGQEGGAEQGGLRQPNLEGIAGRVGQAGAIRSGDHRGCLDTSTVRRAQAYAGTVSANASKSDARSGSKLLVQMDRRDADSSSST